jgi:ATP-dependent Zn protease
MEHKKTVNSLIEIKAIALALGDEEITIESLSKAVLIYSESRKVLAKKLETEEHHLESIPIINYNVPDNIEDIKWPDMLFKSTYTSLYDELGLENDDESGSKSDFEDDLDTKMEIEDVDELIEKLVEEVGNDYWFKKYIFKDLSDLVEKLNIGIERTIRSHPYYNENLLVIKKLLYSRITEAMLRDKDEPVLPIMVITSEDNNIALLFRELADVLGYRFRYFDENDNSDSYLLMSKDKYPLSMSVFNFRDSEIDSIKDIQKMTTYYETGILSEQNTNSDTTLDNLFDPKISNTDVRFIVNNHIIIFLIHVSHNVNLDKEMTNSQLKDKVLSHYYQQSKSEVREITNERYRVLKYLFRLAKASNVAFFDSGCSESKIAFLLSFTKDIMKRLKRYSIDYTEGDVHKIVMLSLMKVGKLHVKELETIVANIVFSIEGLLVLRAIKKKKIRICYNTPQLEIASLLANADLKIDDDDVLSYIYEEFLRQNLKISFSVGYDERKMEIQIKDVVVKSDIKEGHLIIQRPKIRFRDVVGYEDVKKRFRMIIEYYKNTDHYKDKNIKMSNRILLHGPPGTGKTMLAQAFAGEIGYPYFAISAAEITSQKYAGEGGLLLREIFDKAKRMSPSVLFLDELDAFSNRDQFGGGGDLAYEARTIINNLLVLLDGFEDNSDVIVIGATNRPEDLDSALTRSRRFGLKFELASLTAPEREELIKKHLNRAVCSEDYENIVEYIKNHTYGDFPPAKIVDLVEEIKFYSIVEKKRSVTIKDIEVTIDKFIFGEKIKQLDPEFRKNVAFHEAGHTIVYHHLFPENTIQRVSVGYRKSSVGLTLYGGKNEEDIPSLIKNSELVNRLCTSLGGMQAEKIKYGHWDIGSSDDMLTATKLSTILSTHIELGHGVKPAIHYSFITMGLANEGLTALIRDIASSLIEVCTAMSYEILKRNWKYVEAVAFELEKKEDLSWADLLPLLKGMPHNEEPLIKMLEGKVVDI